MPKTFSELNRPLIEGRETTSDWTQRDDIVAAVSTCPASDCSALAIEYKSTGSVRPDHPEDWEFTCSRCGMEFTVAEGELIFQSVPKQWLSANIQVAQATMPSRES